LLAVSGGARVSLAAAASAAALDEAERRRAEFWRL
jgi:hypothetical protein